MLGLQMLPKRFQEPLGHTMSLQDSDKSSPRDHQESLEDLEERSKSSPEAAKSAPGGPKSAPKEAPRSTFKPMLLILDAGPCPLNSVAGIHNSALVYGHAPSQ